MPAPNSVTPTQVGAQTDFRKKLNAARFVLISKIFAA
jgi:hypothetical protein